MPLSSTNINWVNGSYERDRNELILPEENAQLHVNDMNQGVHLDSDGRLVIGFGVDLQIRPASESRTLLNNFINSPDRVMTARHEEVLDAFNDGRAIILPGDPLNGVLPTAVQVQTALGDVNITRVEATSLFDDFILSQVQIIIQS